MVKVLLRQDVPNLGKAGEVKTVADGFARNYLIPHRLAVLADGQTLKQAKSAQEAEVRHHVRVQQQAQELGTLLHEMALAFDVRAGENEQLYGSITNADIAEALEARLGQAIDRRRIELDEPIRRLGSYRVPIRLADSTIVHIGVVVQRHEE